MSYSIYITSPRLYVSLDYCELISDRHLYCCSIVHNTMEWAINANESSAMLVGCTAVKQHFYLILFYLILFRWKNESLRLKGYLCDECRKKNGELLQLKYHTLYYMNHLKETDDYLNACNIYPIAYSYFNLNPNNNYIFKCILVFLCSIFLLT